MNKRKIVEKWIEENGASDFDLKKKDIILFDGGLFSIEKKDVLRHKILGTKKLPNGCSQVIFSKNKTEPGEEYKAIFWMQELDEVIDYFKRMKKMLNSIGFKTGNSHFKKWKK